MFWQSLRRRKPRSGAASSARPTAPQLALELLEDRVAFSVSVGLDEGQNLVVTGDDLKNNVVIEERGENNAEKWVYVNGKLATDGPLLATGGKVIVDLQGGNDNLIIRSARGGDYTNAKIDYQINLGAGNDTFLLQTRDVTNSSLTISGFDAGAGADNVSIALDHVTDSFVGLSEGVFANLGSGDDVASLKWLSTTDSTLQFGGSGESAPVGLNFGLGKDRLDVVKGNVTGGSVSISADLGDRFIGSKGEIGRELGNVARIQGNARISDGAEVSYAIYGGSDRDVVTYDDDRIVGDSGCPTTVSTLFDLGDGHDSLTITTDADRKRFVNSNDVNNAEWNLHVDLGDGKDKYRQAFTSSAWGLAGGASFDAEIDGGDDNDDIAMTVAKNLFTLNGDFNVLVEGGSGNDNLTVSLGNVLRQGPGALNVEVYGEHSLSLQGSPNVSTTINRIESDKDQLTVAAKFLAASTPDPLREGEGPGTEGYQPSASFVIVGGSDDDKIGAHVSNPSTALTVHVYLEAGDSKLDRTNEHFNGNIEVIRGPVQEDVY